MLMLWLLVSFLILFVGRKLGWMMMKDGADGAALINVPGSPAPSHAHCVNHDASLVERSNMLDIFTSNDL